MQQTLPISAGDATAPCPLCGTDARAFARINRRVRYRCTCGLTFDLIGERQAPEPQPSPERERPPEANPEVVQLIGSVLSHGASGRAVNVPSITRTVTDDCASRD